MTPLEQISAKLIESRFYIHATDPIGCGHQIGLCCGAIINVYFDGAVLIHGKFISKCKEESIRVLETLLPSDTVWLIN